MGLKNLLLGISASVLLIAPVKAGQPEPDKAIPTAAIEQQQPDDCRNVGATLVKLGHFVDLWRDANLQNDGNRVRQYEMELTEMLRDDIRQCMEQMDHCKQKLCSESTNGSVSTVSDSDLQRAELLSDLHDADQLLKAKKYLLSGITRTGAFSNKFRLLGDYMELLRRELDRTAVRVAVSDEDDPAEDDPANR
jgi:hypothetical protein